VRTLQQVFDNQQLTMTRGAQSIQIGYGRRMHTFTPVCAMLSRAKVHKCALTHDMVHRHIAAVKEFSADARHKSEGKLRKGDVLVEIQGKSVRYACVFMVHVCLCTLQLANLNR
jgi:hypothetical protein